MSRNGNPIWVKKSRPGYAIVCQELLGDSANCAMVRERYITVDAETNCRIPPLATH